MQKELTKFFGILILCKDLKEDHGGEAPILMIFKERLLLSNYQKLSTYITLYQFVLNNTTDVVKHTPEPKKAEKSISILSSEFKDCKHDHSL